MNDIEYVSHTKWECKHHIVRIPKYRRKFPSFTIILARICRRCRTNLPAGKNAGCWKANRDRTGSAR